MKKPFKHLFNVLCVLIFHTQAIYSFNITTAKAACRPEDGYFRCKVSRVCIPRYFVRDIDTDCKDPTDQSDESEPITCSDDEFKCRVTSNCIPRSLLKIRKSCINDDIILSCREEEEFTCVKSRRCLKRWDVMDGKADCETQLNSNQIIEDKSDEEIGLTCLDSEFSCDPTNIFNKTRCIPREWVGDGVRDCANGRDEIIQFNECIKESEFHCVEEGRCIPRYRVRDGFNDCLNGSDEVEPLKCIPVKEFRCNVNGRCLPRSWRGNDVVNCFDGSDEIAMTSNETCTSDEFLCYNGRRCIPRKLLCDSIDHCGDCSDEIESCDNPWMFRCPNDPERTCTQMQYSCDYFNDCPNSDEDFSSSPGFKCLRDQFSLSGQSRFCTIPQWSLNDSYPLCEDGSDICFINGSFQCIRCLKNNLIIAPRQLCDGIFDCPDFYDECLCSESIETSRSQSLCNNVCYGDNSQSCAICDQGDVLCDNLCISSDKVCDGVIDCPVSKLDEFSCRKDLSNELDRKQTDFKCDETNLILTTLLSAHNLQNNIGVIYPDNATKCDGIFECGNFEDECSERANCSEKSHGDYCATIPFTTISFRSFGVINHPFTVTTRKCSGHLSFVWGWSICNGILECELGEDEYNCTDRFFCDAGTIQFPQGRRNVVSISTEKKCDLKADCVDASDEVGCPTDKHFYCESGNPVFLSRTQVLDGIRDCNDSSDECPPEQFNNDAVSSREELIKSKHLKTLIWFMSIFSLSGNAVVIFTTIRSLLSSAKSPPANKPSSVSVINQMLILNLSSSDFLMGLVLLSIGIKATQFSGHYCLQDKIWRTSNLCTGIGAMTILSSETSVFTLVCITSYRFYTIFWPIRSRQIRKTFACAWIIFIWLASFVIALIPLARSLANDMISGILIAQHRFFPTDRITLSQLTLYTRRLAGLSHMNSTGIPDNLHDLENFLSANFKEESPRVLGYFGYYSANGVCIPRFYRSEGDTDDVNILSSVVISFNFIALLYIVTSYIAIYHRIANGGIAAKTKQKNQKTSRKLQRNVTILIMVEVCCWFPICIMTFLSMGGVVLSPTAYAVSAIVLLPINSSLNPIIYTDALPFIWNRLNSLYVKVRSLVKVTPRAVRDVKESGTQEIVEEERL